MRVLVLSVLLAVATSAAADDTPPVVGHAPPGKATKGQTLTLSFQIHDESEVFLPVIHLRHEGESGWTTRELQARGKTFVYEFELAGDVEYWVEAYDEFGNGPGLSGSSRRPHRVVAETPAPRVARPAPAPAPVKAPPPPEDTTPPVLVHTPLTEAKAGEVVTIDATITDESGVFAPLLHVRSVGGTHVSTRDLVADGDVYRAEAGIDPPFEYWLEAYDSLGNGPSRSGTARKPHKVALAAPEPEPEPAPELVAAAIDPLEPVYKPSGSRTGWWIGGAVGTAGAVVAGVVVYGLLSAQQDQQEAWLVTSPSRRR